MHRAQNEHMRNYSMTWPVMITFAALLGPMAAGASAQNTLGGHIGIVLPLVSRADGRTTTISDDFVIGFPMGITIRKSPTFAFDLELVPGVQNDPLSVGLTVHPGVVWGVGGGWGAGGRLAFDVNKPSWGFTPILNHGLLKVGKDGTLFGEFVLPVRFQENSAGKSFTSVGFGVHLGVGF
jgi:hypothetical protein